MFAPGGEGGEGRGKYLEDFEVEAAHCVSVQSGGVARWVYRGCGGGRGGLFAMSRGALGGRAVVGIYSGVDVVREAHHPPL